MKLLNKERVAPMGWIDDSLEKSRQEDLNEAYRQGQKDAEKATDFEVIDHDKRSDSFAGTTDKDRAYDAGWQDVIDKRYR